MNQIQASKWLVQVNTSSYGRKNLPEALEREFLPHKKFKKPEVFSRRGAHLDTEYLNFIKDNILIRIIDYNKNLLLHNFVVLTYCVTAV